ncbi:ATP-binding protein [Burkholderia anthina]|nr:ATP-binding protein [Burkholderia anthina]KVX34779.1 ATP-binding protein [Burkholderia anthina]
MPRTKAANESATKRLSDVVSISRQFMRSVRIDADFGREDALSGYICQGTARSLVENMARQIVETRQRAFTWTGPYGGGKSSLALMLCSLVGPQVKLRTRARQILGFPENSLVERAFASKGDGWLVLPVVGKRGSVINELSTALARAQSPSKSRKTTNIIGDLVSAAENHPHGVLVVVDELGKFLESSAQDGDDIYFFQELAEAASRCAGKLVVVGILHQAFEAYATRLGRQARDDWAKVQGRFVDIPLVSATDEVIELVGRAIQVTNGPDLAAAGKLAERIASAVRERRPGTPATLADSLKRCWPLHPVTAALLGPISKRRFGQNERSTFGFLASREPLGFAEFLDGYAAEWQYMYGPSRYWEYLRANLEPAILASPDGHRWALAAEAVERAEAKGQDIHVQLTKTVALIEMFRNGSGLVADSRVLSVSIPSATDHEIRKALHELADWKVLIERKHLGAWGVYAGSDFDIEGAINSARAELGEPDLDRISSLTDLQPILAKRLYHQTGTMRWFARRIVQLSDVEQHLDRFKSDPRSAGAFLMCLPDTGQSLKSAEHRVRKASEYADGRTILLGAPRNAERISELSLELAAAERVTQTRPELHGDSVARRELVGRIEAIRSSLEEELADAFSLSRWYSKGEVVGKEYGTVLSAIASSIAAEVYNKTPYIFSELINREEPSSNSVKARKELMYRMITHGHREALGYEGYPADAGLYFTVLQSLGLHRPRDGGQWGFGDPSMNPSGQSMEALWYRTKNFVLDSGKSTTLADLYALWASPPFGLRAGVMPILALAFFLAHRSSLAMYVDGVFTSDLSEAVIDEWILDATAIRFQHVEASKDQVKLVDAIARSVSDHTQTEVGKAPLDAARGLVGLVVSLPGWSKRTTTISTLAQDVRAMLLKANDPHKVLFADLPTLLDAREPEELVTKLSAITSELSVAYDNMLNFVRTRLLDALDHTQGDVESLRQRAATIKGITGDFRLDAFAARLEAYDEDPQTIEGLISLAVNKPATAWVDRDVDAAVVTLATWAIEFRKTEIMAHLRGRPSTRRVIGVVFGASHGMDVSQSIDIAEKDVPVVDRLVKSILARTQGEKPEVVLAALAEAGALMANQGKKERHDG